jgi:GxxExxY protein
VRFEPISTELDVIAKQIVNSAYEVHTTLGPGLLETVYEKCFRYELSLRGIGVATQVSVPIVYKGLTLGEQLRLDMLVENQIIIELKAVEQMHPVFEAQLLTYLKLSGKGLGFLLTLMYP